ADRIPRNRRTERLRFKGLYIKQGTLAIRADEAEADRLDFEDTVWTFSGNVLIENSTTRVWSDDAQVAFLNHQVDTATLQGSPARFEQVREEDERITRGRSAVMDYALETGIISMTGDAWVSDGANEVSGPRIAYDVTRDLIKAAGDEDGQVKMRIIPPEDRKPDLP
ncbi:MAG: lipopolysaccharide transport periplasmic protein LptA, partial [Gammaproteobacteria bacterium]|nr:lipopolysaccharide transport periplasmic protein LptA [Gammaproteobacteria bacterium]